MLKKHFEIEIISIIFVLISLCCKATIIHSPVSIWGSSGGMYVSVVINSTVFLHSNYKVLNTVAGVNGVTNYNGDNMKATSAHLYHPFGVWADTMEVVYISDTLNSRVRKVATNGIISTIVGRGFQQFSQETSGPATSTHLNVPFGLWGNTVGHLFLADRNNNRVVKVNLTSGMLSLVAGAKLVRYNGDNIPASAAQLQWPSGVWGNSLGFLYIADTSNNRVRMVSPESQLISTVFGNGGDGINSGIVNSIFATETFANHPTGIFGDSVGSLYVVCQFESRVRKVSKPDSSNDHKGVVSTIAGQRWPAEKGNGHPATSSELHQPHAVWADSAGSAAYIADTDNNEVRKVSLVDGTITRFIGDDLAADVHRVSDDDAADYAPRSPVGRPSLHPVGRPTLGRPSLRPIRITTPHPTLLPSPEPKPKPKPVHTTTVILFWVFLCIIVLAVGGAGYYYYFYIRNNRGVVVAPFNMIEMAQFTAIPQSDNSYL